MMNILKYRIATPQDGQAITMEYNLQGNRKKQTDPDAGVIASKLNYQLRSGEKTNYGYDNLYRLKWVSIKLYQINKITRIDICDSP